MEYGLFGDTRLRDVPYDVYLDHGARLPSIFRRWAEHYYSEMVRVEQGIKAWKGGDLKTFGSLITETLTRTYLSRFPQYADLFSVHYYKSDDGVRVG